MKRTKESQFRDFPTFPQTKNTSSAQVFEGDDQNYEQRVQENKQTQKEWIFKQMDEKAGQKKKQQEDEKINALQQQELIRMRGLLQQEQQASWNKVVQDQKNTNWALAEEKRNKEKQEKQSQLEYEQAELKQLANRKLKRPLGKTTAPKGCLISASEIKSAVNAINQIKVDFPNNIMAQAFDEQWFNTLTENQKLRLLTCCKSGIDNPDSAMGCYAYNPSDYDEFNRFFGPALSMYHKVDLSVKKHINNWSFKGVEGLPENGLLDFTKLGLPALSMRVRTGRNLQKYPLPGAMTKDDRVNMELELQQVFDCLINMPEYGGRYVSITPGNPNFIDTAEYDELVKAHIMFKDMSKDSFLLSAGIAADWPYGRGCYVSGDRQFIIWVGEEDHLRIMCMKKGEILNEVFDRLRVAVEVAEQIIPGGCAKSKDFGVVTSCPTNIGTGMRASVHIALPNLTSDGTDAKAKAIARPLGLSVRGLGGEHTPIGADGTVDISPSARFCISEAEIVTALYKGISLLKAEEDKVAS